MKKGTNKFSIDNIPNEVWYVKLANQSSGKGTATHNEETITTK